MANALDIALNYVAKGWCPVPVNYRSKKPSAGNDWQLRIIDASNAPDYFNGDEMNIGVLLGPSSHGLTDVDLDCEAARAVAPYILPRTGAIFGRASSRASHWLFYTDLSVTTDKAVVVFNDPTTGGRLLELRIGGDSGAQTVFPGSVHEEGETIAWEESGEPASVNGDELNRHVHHLAAYALIARHWPAPGSKARHNAALILGGFLARTGMETQNIKIATEAIAKAANDNEWRNRREAAEDAAKAFHSGKHAFGLTGMRTQFGDAVADQIAEWLGYDGSGEHREETPTPEPTPEPTTEPTPGLEVRDAGDDTKKPPPRRWLLGNQFCRKFLSGLVAPGSTGKSALRLPQCLSLATGRKLVGQHVFKRGRVLLISLEDDDDEMRRRILAARIHHKVSLDEVKGWLFYACPKGIKLAEMKNGSRHIGLLEKQLRASIERFRADLVVLDPFVKLHALEENDNGAMDFVCDLLVTLAIEYDIAVDAPHHTRKGQLTPGDPDAGRGGSAARDAGRLIYTLTAMNEDEAKTFGINPEERTAYVRLDKAKVNLAPPARTAEWFKLVGVPLDNATDEYPEYPRATRCRPSKSGNRQSFGRGWHR
jgi:hypothetical protein